jgi:dGTPase
MTIREQLEAREREYLAPQAARSASSRGRVRDEAPDAIRPAFQRDRDRIIPARLPAQAQDLVVFAPTGDHRTRLTHTQRLQIARSIAKVLRLQEELMKRSPRA